MAITSLSVAAIFPCSPLQFLGRRTEKSPFLIAVRVFNNSLVSRPFVSIDLVFVRFAGIFPHNLFFRSSLPSRKGDNQGAVRAQVICITEACRYRGVIDYILRLMQFSS